MLAAGFAHPGDRGPSPGSFEFWSTASAHGHVALVATSDAYCDLNRITLVSSDIFDSERGNTGGVGHVTSPTSSPAWSMPTVTSAGPSRSAQAQHVRSLLIGRQHDLGR